MLDHFQWCWTSATRTAMGVMGRTADSGRCLAALVGNARVCRKPRAPSTLRGRACDWRAKWTHGLASTCRLTPTQSWHGPMAPDVQRQTTTFNTTRLPASSAFLAKRVLTLGLCVQPSSAAISLLPLERKKCFSQRSHHSPVVTLAKGLKSYDTILLSARRVRAQINLTAA